MADLTLDRARAPSLTAGGRVALRRFLGVRSRRKARYARLLVEALDPDRAPEPLAAVLARTASSSRR